MVGELQSQALNGLVSIVTDLEKCIRSRLRWNELFLKQSLFLLGYRLSNHVGCLPFQKNALACDVFYPGCVDAPVRAVLRRDNAIEISVVFVPLPLSIPCFPIRWHRQHSQVFPK